jgi:hypothetical protein
LTYFACDFAIPEKKEFKNASFPSDLCLSREYTGNFKRACSETIALLHVSTKIVANRKRSNFSIPYMVNFIVV